MNLKESINKKIAFVGVIAVLIMGLLSFSVMKGCDQSNIPNPFTASDHLVGDGSSSIVFVSPTPPNGSTTTNNWVDIQANITESNLQNLTWNWNGTNYNLYDNSLVLFYNFDNRSALGENDTTVKDLSMYGNNGTVVGGENISWVANGKYNGAFKFTGKKNYIQLSSTGQPVINTDFTLSYWTKIYKTGTYQTLDYNKDSGNKMFSTNINPNGSISIQVFNASSTGTTYTTPIILSKLDNWYYVTITMQNNTLLNIYVNGVLSYNVIMPENSTKVGTPVWFIGSSRGTGNYLNGSLDNIMIFNRTLSLNEISQLYNTQLTKYDPNTWSFAVNQTNLTIGSMTYSATENNLSTGINLLN
jgi:hypothetical protein